MLLPEDSASRKLIPLYSGVLAYFPSALVEVAKRSQQGNDQHNVGQPLHWARDKSTDHKDCILRHLVEDDLVGVAWRALAALQLKCEAEGAPVAPGARVAGEDHNVSVLRYSADNPAPSEFVDYLRSVGFLGPHAVQYSVSTTPAGAQSGEVIDVTRTAYQGKNYPSNSDGS